MGITNIVVDVAKVCPHSKTLLERWVAVYKRGVEKALEPKADYIKLVQKRHIFKERVNRQT